MFNPEYVSRILEDQYELVSVPLNHSFSHRAAAVLFFMPSFIETLITGDRPNPYETHRYHSRPASLTV